MEEFIKNEEKLKKQLTYALAYNRILTVYKRGTVDKRLLERLNDKCAKDMGCEVISLKTI